MVTPRKPARVREAAINEPSLAKRPTNLTLSADALARAEHAALDRGSSISQLVDDLLMALPVGEAREQADDLPPAVRRLLGIARATRHDLATAAVDYREYLYRKYGADQ